MEIPYTAGVLLGMRVDVDAAARTVTSYTSADGATWTQPGSAKTTATPATMFGGTSPIEMTG
ncbi:hypothetical protein CH254_22295 [Rhodococcus sp. 06-412-2C]|uniref:hypothetical protein n=1 Tax=unclassified Rhodococcus (in: high G+C Gram-positive bacteria) TaxID=192944 RepID=UPI000B9B6DE2|nr:MULTISPECIES: hypothetical protein [unclassified Rhodococcus (in: high G+C Gram-positive bacteria)]OZC83663.1 hypothetical protein CH254_22295 [Rhodococcus sp. 06-412-2C]OZC93850.1 hypothetical protein CH279_20375 [Rhodococcus sp. 06-412-2B]